MRHAPTALRSGIVLATVALVPLAETAAQPFWDPATRNPTLTSRVCDIPVGNTGIVRIIAGPLPGPFPATVQPGDDGNCPGPDACLRWDYRWIYPGFNPSLGLVSVASTVKVKSAPGASPIYPPTSSIPPVGPLTFDTSLEYGNVGGELGLRYTQNAQTYNVSFYTDTNAGVGAVTAGFKSGNRRGFCAIAGATSAQTGDQLLSSPSTLITTTLGCTVSWQQSPDGCVTNATTTTPNCGIVVRPLVVNNRVATTASCGTEVAGPFGSTETCRWSSILRQTICVTVP